MGEKVPTCYACGQKGHYSSDSKCLKYNARPRMAAIQEADDQEEQPHDDSEQIEDQPDTFRLVVEDDEDDEDQEQPLIGEQYLSEEEEYVDEDELEYLTKYEDEDVAYIRALRVENDDTQQQRISSMDDRQSKTADDQVRLALRRSKVSRDRPEIPVEDIRPLVARMKLNGLVAIVLLDTGSTPDAISPDFARVANLKVFALNDPIALQLGCRGSQSKISYGTNCPVEYEGIDQRHYFDVVNVDRYDAIIGLGFLQRFDIVLDPAWDHILIQGRPVVTLSEGEEREEFAHRQSMRKVLKPRIK